jgi:hypothetical protein
MPPMAKDDVVWPRGNHLATKERITTFTSAIAVRAVLAQAREAEAIKLVGVLVAVYLAIVS